MGLLLTTYHILASVVNLNDFDHVYLLPIEEMFLTLICLRLGLMEQDLAFRFDISQSMVSRICITWINFMYIWSWNKSLYGPPKNPFNEICHRHLKTNALVLESLSMPQKYTSINQSFWNSNKWLSLVIKIATPTKHWLVFRLMVLSFLFHPFTQVYFR